MKFSCTQENLNRGLAVVSHIANKNINLPILGNVLIKCEDKVLRLTTTNLEIAVSCTVRGKIEDGGEFTVPSRLFSDYVALLPKDQRVDVGQEGSALAIACASYQTKLNGLPASEFPLVPSVDKKWEFSVKVEELRRAIGQTLFAVAPNESRPEISGVLFRFSQADGVKLTLAATDSYRLAEKVLSASGGGKLEEPVSVIVPSRTVAEVVRILGVFKDDMDTPETIGIGVGESQVVFSCGDVEVISRTIEGRYPDYRQLIPDKHQTEFAVAKDELQRAIKTTSLFSRAGLNDIHFGFSQEKVGVRSANSQTGEHSVDLEGDVKGKDNEITVNFKYLLDGVNNIETEAVLMQLNDNSSPCVVRPAGAEDYLYIVMPIRQ